VRLACGLGFFFAAIATGGHLRLEAESSQREPEHKDGGVKPPLQEQVENQFSGRR
jgi:hypothetical protein